MFDSRQLYSTGVGVCLGNTSPPVGRCNFLKRSPLKVLCPPQIHGVLAFRLLVHLRSDFTGTGRAVKVVVGTNCGLRCYCNILLHDTRELPRWEAAGYQEGGLCPNLLVDLKSTQAELTTAMHPEHHIPRVRDREGRSGWSQSQSWGWGFIIRAGAQRTAYHPVGAPFSIVVRNQIA